MIKMSLSEAIAIGCTQVEIDGQIYNAIQVESGVALFSVPPEDLDVTIEVVMKTWDQCESFQVLPILDGNADEEDECLVTDAELKAYIKTLMGDDKSLSDLFDQAIKRGYFGMSL